MFQRWTPAATLSIVLMLAGCFGAGDSSLPRPDSPGSEVDDGVEQIVFRQPVVLTLPPEDQGREPSLEIDSQGVVYVCSVRGLARGTNLWRSRDNGMSFDYLGERIHSATPPKRSLLGDAGGGDCDLGVDAGNRVYLVDTWGGDVSVVSSNDQGETWSGVPVSYTQPVQDRPWALGGATNELFIISVQLGNAHLEGAPAQPAGGIWVIRSTDGGMTFPQQVLAVSNDERPGWYSNLVSDRERLYFVYHREVYRQEAGESKLIFMVATSKDRGGTWQRNVIAERVFAPDYCSVTTQFPVVATDGAGGVYAVWALDNLETGRVDLLFTSSSDGGEHWIEPVVLTDRPGTRAFPWIAAGAPGRVGIAWYETNLTLDSNVAVPDVNCRWRGAGVEEAAWFLRYAFSDNAASPRPMFQETLLQQEPIHRGELDRPYAELLQVEFDTEGRAAIAFVADTPEADARPMFALQASGSLGKR